LHYAAEPTFNIHIYIPASVSSVNKINSDFVAEDCDCSGIASRAWSWIYKPEPKPNLKPKPQLMAAKCS